MEVTSHVLKGLWWRSYEKVVFFGGISGSNTARMSKPQMETMLITFLNIKGTVHFEFISQGQTVNQDYFFWKY
jgi:hypothetical protein